MPLDNNYRKDGLIKEIEAKQKDPKTLYKLRNIVKFNDRAKDFLLNECKEVEHNMILISERSDVLRLLTTGAKVVYEDGDISIRYSAVLGYIVVSSKMCMTFVQDAKMLSAVKEIKFYAGDESQINESLL